MKLKRIVFLTAVVVATGLLSAGTASAILTNAVVTCEGIGDERFCVPSSPQPALDTLFVVSDANEGLFNIVIEDRAIALTFPDALTGEDLDTTGFRLSGLVSLPDPNVVILGVDYVTGWADIPVTSPTVTNVGGVATIEWTALTGGDPSIGAIARINLAFGTADGNQAPTAEVNGPYEGVVGTPVQFISTGSSDPDGTIETYEWNFGDGSTGSGPAPSHTYTGGALYNVTLTVTDDEGVAASEATTADIGALSQPPMADAGGPYTGTENVAVTFDGAGSSDPDGSIASYTWDFGDGSDLNIGTSPTTTHTYSGTDTYVVILTVTDASGNTDKDVTVARIALGYLPPEADAGGPYEGQVGVAVTFDGTGSSGAIVSRDWFFGDGEPNGDGETTTHIYRTPGLYNVTLSVGDVNGASDSDSTLVVITGDPDNAPPDCSLAVPSVDVIWPPDRWFVPIEILGVTDPEGDPVSITISSIFQDEPVGRRPDGLGVGSDTAWVRTQSGPGGNGRIYHIGYRASDGLGGICRGEVLVGVPLTEDSEAVDDGANFDASVPSRP